MSEYPVPWKVEGFAIVAADGETVIDLSEKASLAPAMGGFYGMLLTRIVIAVNKMEGAHSWQPEKFAPNERGLP